MILLGLMVMLGLLSACAPPALPPTPTLAAPKVSMLTATPTATATDTPTLTPTPTQTPTPTLTPTPTITPTPAVTKQAVTAAQATPETLTIVVTEAQANEMAKKALAQQQDVQIDNPRVDFRPGEMLVSGDTTLGFFKLSIGVLATVAPVDGKPEVTVKEIYVNGDRATGFLRQQIEAMITPYLSQLALVSDNFYVESITISDDAMTVRGRYR